MKKARIITKEYDENRAKQLAKELKVSLPIAKLLLTRQIADREAAERFLQPRREQLHDPLLLADMERAAELILAAVRKQDSICIYGDYDVDGITATSVLYLFLQAIGADVRYYLPDRMKDGYGLNEEAVRKLAGQGVRLLVTVDTGISAVKEVALAKELGLTVVVTDHHECQELLPAADAVVDPKRPDDRYPFKQIAGAGVAFKLICALTERLKESAEERAAAVIPDPFDYIELAALGTISDLMPLIDENRVLVKEALERMKKTKNEGLKALLAAAEIEPDKVSSTAVAFRIGPRLNAAGRMGDAARGVELFLADDAEKAAALARELNEENKRRQETENRIVEEALNKIGAGGDQSKILVVAGEGWHHGVIGIVASRLLERFYRPVIVLAIEGEKAVGSARSVAGFNLFEALCSCKDLYSKFGGHEMAAGMTLAARDIDQFRQKLNEYAEDTLTEELLTPLEPVDFAMKLSEVSLPLLEEMELLAPYGQGNPEPKFLVESGLAEVRQMGKEKQHLRLGLRQGRTLVDGVAFFEGQEADRLSADFTVKAAGCFQINEWNGIKKPQLMVSYFSQDESVGSFVREMYRALREQDIGAWPYAALGRAEYKRIYLQLRQLATEDKQMISWRSFPFYFGRTKRELAGAIAGLAVFEELGLCRPEWTEQGFAFTLIEGKKTELEQSAIYQALQGVKDKIAECYIRMNELKKGAGSALDGKSQVRSREEKGL